MPVTKVTFSKIATNPSAHAWSQTYSAGNFAALISLANKEGEENALQTLGSQIVSILESEYFALEEKNLTAIKSAVEQTISHIPEGTDATIIVATVINTALYLFLFGNGRVFIKRGEEIGILLEKPSLAIPTEPVKPGVLTSSGYLKNGDCVIMATDALLTHITREDLLAQITPANTEEVAETLMTKLHKKKDGAACAVMLSFISPEDTKPITPTALTPEPAINYTIENNNKFPRIAIPSIHWPALSKRWVFIAAAVVIIIIIVVNIFLSLKHQKEKQEAAKFQSAYMTALSKYSEGNNLIALNKAEARDDFTQVITLLTPFQGKFQPASAQNDQLTNLLKKAQDGLTAAKAENQISGKQASESDTPLLGAEMKNSDAKYASEDNAHIYLGTDNEILSQTKSNTANKTVIKNGGDWSAIGGLGTYLGNIYVLDKKGTLLKYLVASNGFSKTDYFSANKIDLSNAQGIAIDGSVYILFDDGSIRKFTKGKLDSFSVSGLDKPLAHPTRIYTTVDENNMYVLDNGNSRIVVLTKEGAFQAQYTADFLSQAKDFEVVEKDKKIFVLSSNKLWEVDIK